VTVSGDAEWPKVADAVIEAWKYTQQLSIALSASSEAGCMRLNPPKFLDKRIYAFYNLGPHCYTQR